MCSSAAADWPAVLQAFQHAPPRVQGSNGDGMVDPDVIFGSVSCVVILGIDYWALEVLDGLLLGPWSLGRWVFNLGAATCPPML